MKEVRPEDIQTMDFEIAFTALQENVTQLESEDLPLEKSLALFERGQKLAKRCAQLLEEAELRVRTLSENAAEEQKTED